jgi:hypothetical protein
MSRHYAITPPLRQPHYYAITLYSLKLIIDTLIDAAIIAIS